MVKVVFYDGKSRFSLLKSHFYGSRSRFAPFKSHFYDSKSQLSPFKSHFYDGRSQLSPLKWGFYDERRHYIDNVTIFAKQNDTIFIPDSLCFLPAIRGGSQQAGFCFSKPANGVVLSEISVGSGGQAAFLANHIDHQRPVCAIERQADGRQDQYAVYALRNLYPAQRLGGDVRRVPVLGRNVAQRFR